MSPLGGSLTRIEIPSISIIPICSGPHPEKQGAEEKRILY
jgi:hypothetical protein